MNSDQLEVLQHQANRFSPPAGLVLPGDPFAAPQAGQVWITQHHDGALSRTDGSLSDTLEVIILRVDDVGAMGGPLYLAAPLTSDCHMAGPKDVLLAKNILGYRSLVMLGCALSVVPGSLHRCIGILPEDEVEKLKGTFTAFETGSMAGAGVVTGFDYLDEQDLRYIYHEEMVERLSYLQIPVLDWMEHKAEDLIGKPVAVGVLVRIDGWLQAIEEAQLALAAAELHLFKPALMFHAVAQNVFLQLNASGDWKQAIFQVLDDHGMPSPVLDGAQIMVSDAAVPSASISRTQALVDIAALREGFALVDGAGSPISIHPLESE